MTGGVDIYGQEGGFGGGGTDCEVQFGTGGGGGGYTGGHGGDYGGGGGSFSKIDVLEQVKKVNFFNLTVGLQLGGSITSSLTPEDHLKRRF